MSNDILHLERLVAHRELQLARAFSRRNSDYIARRQGLLDDARELLAQARARVNVSKLCRCGQTFITVTADDRRCPACRREHLIRGVRIIEWLGGFHPPGRMLVQRVDGLTDVGARVVEFVATQLVGEGRLYEYGRFDRDEIRVLRWRPREDLAVRLRADGELNSSDWHATHKDAPRVLRREGAWAVDTEMAWGDE